MGAWINLDLLTCRVVGRRLEQGPTYETDEAVDKLMILRPWTARCGLHLLPCELSKEGLGGCYGV